MNLILAYDRIKNAVSRRYRRCVFKHRCNIGHYDFKLVGKVTLINTNVKIGKGTVIYPDVVFMGDGEIVIGEQVHVGPGTVFYSSKKGGIQIGDYTNIAAQVYIIDMDHGLKPGILLNDQENTVAKIDIGKDVWIAAGVKVLKGTIIEDGAVIGAGAVAKGIYRKNTISVGLPAKEIRVK